MMQSRQQRQAVQVIKRSVFEELRSILPTMKLTQQSEFKTVERVLRQQNGGVIMCQESQKVCWSNVIRMPGEQRDSRNITFKVVSNNRHGQSCIKIYSVPRQEEVEVMEPQRRAVIKMVIRLPSQVSEQLEMRETRIVITREGLVLVKVPLRIRCEQQRFQELLRQLPHNSIVVVKSRQQRVLHAEEDCFSTRRSIFEELEHVIRRNRRQQEPCDLEILEQLLKESNNNYFQQEWTTFVPLKQQQQQQKVVQQVIRNIIFRVKRNEQKGTQYIKIIGRKQWSDNNEKICIKVHVPVDFKPRQLRFARVQYTREGLVLIRVPSRLHQVISTEDTNTFTNTQKQCIEVIPRTIFEELKNLVYRQPQPHQQWSVELLEQLLRERDNLVQCNDEQKTMEWITIVRPINNCWNTNATTTTFKVQQARCDEEETLIKLICRRQTQTEELIGESGNNTMKIVVRLPTFRTLLRQRQERFDLRRTRVQLTRDGLIVVRVPLCCNDEFEQQNKNQVVDLLRTQCRLEVEEERKEFEQEEINNNNLWGEACVEMQRLRRCIIALVGGEMQRICPNVLTRFTFNRRCQPLIRLDMQLPSNTIRAEDILVQTRGQSIIFEMRKTTNAVAFLTEETKQRCTLELPQQVCVDQLLVRLDDKTSRLRFDMPVELKAITLSWYQEADEQQIRKIFKNNITMFGDEVNSWDKERQGNNGIAICVEKMM